MGDHRLLSFMLHLAIILFVIAAFPELRRRSSTLLQGAKGEVRDKKHKATQDHPPEALRIFHPVAYDKACRAIKRFEECESSFLYDTRHRTRTFYNALEQSSRCMKHLFRLKRALPNDMTADMRLDYFTDYMEEAMSRSLIAMNGQIKAPVHHIHPTFPFASNYKHG